MVAPGQEESYRRYLEEEKEDITMEEETDGTY